MLCAHAVQKEQDKDKKEVIESYMELRVKHGLGRKNKANIWQNSQIN